MVKNTTGTVREPMSAGIARKATYGTLLSMYESPMLSNLKWPSYPTNQPMRANRSFPNGGWTSKKYVLCRYYADTNYELSFKPLGEGVLRE